MKSYAKIPTPVSVTPPWQWPPFGSLRHEIDRLFDEFDQSFWRSSFPRLGARSDLGLRSSGLVVDVAEHEKDYEITAEVPGIDQKDVEVKIANGLLVIKGEKKREAEEKGKDYYLSERHYGTFERSFQIPSGVDADKIEASFDKGVLKVTLPKSPDAQKTAKTIPIKPA
ncbi:Hsp20/alpha crystallin family protein [Methylovirgula sp. 4M-Z18]|uniref:Hsp20/alpha crystallin family protein n=1 Tax=Methylovirgula sp. 4M-Z18 TaxID=2293567 RepID=UPI001FDF0A1A|nr:Hsp20/alpha crystallin family protein [Methylovirgula sp. 4M-Z18]